MNWLEGNRAVEEQHANWCRLVGQCPAGSIGNV